MQQTLQYIQQLIKMYSDNVQLDLHFNPNHCPPQYHACAHSKLQAPWGLKGRQNSKSQVQDITTRSRWEARQRFRELKRPMLMTELMPEMLCWSSAWCCWSPLRLGIYQPKPPKPLLPSEQREKQQLQSHTRSPGLFPLIWKTLFNQSSSTYPICLFINYFG